MGKSFAGLQKDQLQMDTDVLAARIARDYASDCTPFLIAATAGTTNAGVIDPLLKIAKIAEEKKIWFHVDAAWGGAVALLPESRDLLAGVERSDSVTFDAHKWLSVPMGAGLYLTRHRDILSRTFQIEADYRKTSVDGLTPKFLSVIFCHAKIAYLSSSIFITATLTERRESMKKYVKLIGLLVLCLVFLSGTMTFADEYPAKPIKLIVPWGAGGGTDALMRVIAHFAGKYLGQPMVVVNVPGVGGTMGARQGKDAKPDGYTLTATHESVISSRIVGVSDFDYSDFIPIANMTLTPAMVAAQPNAPWNDMKDMIAAAKKSPATVKFGATLGSTSHFFPLDIANQAGIEFKIVGYEGTAKRQAALLGGFLDLGESNPAAGKKYFEAKKLKPLGIATEERHVLLPDVPTLKEQGVNVLFAVNRGVCAPLKTPQPVIDKLGAVLAKVSQDPEFVEKIASLGSDVKYRDHVGYQAYIKEETSRLDMLAQKFNVKAKKK